MVATNQTIKSNTNCVPGIMQQSVVGYHTQAHEMKHAMLVLHHHHIVNKDMEFIRLNNQNF